MLTLENLKKELKSKANPKCAGILQRFFKTGPGEYGEGDVFLGLAVKDVRNAAQKYKEIKKRDLEKLIHSKIHEQRMCALFILVFNFPSAGEKKKKEIYDFYLKNTKYINNWDLVDLSAYKIIGEYLIDKPKQILYQLAQSDNLWEKRIAVISTYSFIKNKRFKDTLKISKILLNDKEDLIHKAVGWMLREVGNRSLETEEEFLKKHYKKMPRTMLRYAIEKFPENKRQDYLGGRI